MFGNYALVDESGKVTVTSEVPILKIPENMRLSYRSNVIYGGAFDDSEPQRKVVVRKGARAEIKVERSYFTNDRISVRKMYHFTVLGTSSTEVNKLVDETLSVLTNTKEVIIHKKGDSFAIRWVVAWFAKVRRFFRQLIFSIHFFVKKVFVVWVVKVWHSFGKKVK